MSKNKNRPKRAKKHVPQKSKKVRVVSEQNRTKREGRPLRARPTKPEQIQEIAMELLKDYI